MSGYTIDELFSPAMVPDLRDAFEDFISHVQIDSKETGTDFIRPYMGQRMFINEIFDMLENDIHWLVVLKARQLGITTFSLLLDLFWLNYFPGLQGGLVTDTAPNMVGLRTIIARMLNSLPPSHKIAVVQNNINGLVLANGSKLDYLVAGTRKNGGLGRSRAYNFMHGTECSSWGDSTGLESLEKTLAKSYPARLYVFESTARGFQNLFYNMWEQTKSDDLNKRGLFIGWWAKPEEYAYTIGSKNYDRYSAAPITTEEQEKINKVKELYEYEVNMEQLAWYRHEQDPDADRDPDQESDDETIIEQEYPWDEEEAFIVTGSSFFSDTALTATYKEAIKVPFKGYRYHIGEDFLATEIEPVRTAKQAQLKIFQDPDPKGVYVVGADPAYGANENSDRFCIQVLRCFADGWEQVAEFVSPTVKTYQFTWILAHICGVYANARLLMEINGPGEAVFVEFRNLQNMLQNGILRERAQELGLRNVISTVKQYLYHRQDSLGGGYNYHFKTNQGSKMIIFNQLRDVYTLGQGKINSIACLEEMRKIVQDGAEVRGEGAAKDDRVMALTLANRAWIDAERLTLQNGKRTRENELRAPEEVTESMIATNYHATIVESFFSANAARARAELAMARRGRRWNW